MEQESLFESTFEAPVGNEERERAAARVQRPNRRQVEMRMRDLDSLLPEDHRTRVVWSFVEAQDLSVLYEGIRAREDRPGQAAIDPQILMALWLLATLDGVGSAREVERRCRETIGYEWICGGVSVNYHTLSDFRTAHVEVLDALLTRNVAALLSEGLVTMDRVAQDGLKVRAYVGKSSYRRRPKLEELAAEARAQVEALKRELNDDPGAGSRRQRAARERAVRERAERLERSLKQMKQLEEEDEGKRPSQRKGPEKLRVSTTDPEVRVNKMPDGGYAPAVNVQFAGDPVSQVITGTALAFGTDFGQMAPMVAQHKERYGRYPNEMLNDGGYEKGEDIEWVSDSSVDCVVYCPPAKGRKEDANPYAPKRGESEALSRWRVRMGSEEGKAIYRERCKVECVNADARRRGLTQFLVRGKQKVKAVVLWFVLAHNLMRAHTLRLQAT